MRIYATLVAFYTTSLALVTQSLAEKKRTTGQRLLETSSDLHFEQHQPERESKLPASQIGDTGEFVGFLTFRVVGFPGAADSMPASAEANLVEALEEDEQVTVVGDIEIGVLSCEYLEGAEDATSLQFAVSPYETILAEKTSYTYLSGNTFEDGLARKVWVGEEVVDDVMDPRRTVTITWGEICTAETFLLKVTSSELKDGALTVVKSIPCIPDESTDSICVVEVGFSLASLDGIRLKSYQNKRKNRKTLISKLTLQYTAVPWVKQVLVIREQLTDMLPRESEAFRIDLMYLYTEGGKYILGGISDTQMQTTLATALVTANEAMTNSEIDLKLSLVHVGQLPYEETFTSVSTVLGKLQSDESVADLRNLYGADLVHLAGRLEQACGIGYLFDGSDRAGFSALNPLCVDNLSHTHEIGRNLGCYPDRYSSITQTDYAHGYRYCDTTDPYRTIMSDICPEEVSVSRVNWFSNPDVTVLDKASGTADNDCARAIEENMASVSDFRSTVEDVNACFDTTDTAEYRCSGKKNGRIIDLNRCELIDDEIDQLRACFEVVDVTTIKKIKLNVNSFSSLPYDLFDGMDSLTKLNLQRNCDLTCIPPVNAGLSPQLEIAKKCIAVYGQPRCTLRLAAQLEDT